MTPEEIRAIYVAVGPESTRVAQNAILREFTAQFATLVDCVQRLTGLVEAAAAEERKA
jgi:hypothetical protein